MLVCALFLLSGLTQAAPTPLSQPALSMDQLRAMVIEATEPAPRWDGPRTGPPGQSNKTIALISEDLRNGGILGVAQGVQEAALAMHWTVKVFDAGGSPAGRNSAANDALAAHPDGVILIGADAEQMRPRLRAFAEHGVPIVGWHVAARPGPMTNSPVAVNISTDPVAVGRVTAAAAVVGANGSNGVVIFTDPNFQIAETKSRAMADVIRGATNCTLLEVNSVAISKAPEAMPGIVRELLDRYGERWTCALAVNDIYFDYAIPELSKAGKSAEHVRLLSAGDGSTSALMRIQAGIYQTATVAEPLNLHGWQMVDELNRLLAHEPLSGYVAPVHMVNADNVAFDAGPHLRYDPDNGYRAIYRHIWKR